MISRGRPYVSIAVMALTAACSKPKVTVHHTTTSTGGDAYVIGCEESPRDCKEKAGELCPFGHATLEPGVGGWYAPGEDFRHPHSPQIERRRYKLENWVIRCMQPGLGVLPMDVLRHRVARPRPISSTSRG